MKKILLGMLLLSSLTCARDIEQCDGFESEFSELSEKTLNFIVESSSLKSKLTDMSVSIVDVNNFIKSNSEIEDLTDHIMYYHKEDLDNTQLNYVRKSKNLSKKYEEVSISIKLELEKMGK